jgi:hypothetical protein
MDNRYNRAYYLKLKAKNHCRECGKIIKIEKLNLFCSPSCVNVYLVRNKYDFFRKNIDTNEKEFKDNMEDEKQASYEKGLDEGYLNGYLDAEKQFKLCPVCKINKIDSVHHIIPRAKGGITIYENIICLCKKCHDLVEEKTDYFLEKNYCCSPKILRNFIINGFPLSVESEIND